MMRSIAWTLALAVAATALITAPTPAQAQGPAVTQVFIVNVEPQNMAAYMAFVKRAQAIVKDLGLPGFRILQATLAGENTGSLAILIENESLTAMAKNQAKTQGSAKWRKMISEVQDSGISQTVSNSLWIDVTPK